MSDLDYSSFFLDSWTSPESRKKKKGLKKRKKDKNSLKNQDDSQKKKKKKNMEIKESMELSQRKKKKKKKRPVLEHNDEAGGEIEYCLKNKSAEYQKHQSKEPNLDHLTQASTKKGKRKLKVAFNLPTEYAKHPKVSTPEATEAENVSPCNSDDLNSQDLFITQKMFRPSPPDSSSSEASEKCLTASPQQHEETQENNEEAKTPFLASPNRSKSLHKCVQTKEDKPSQITHTRKKSTHEREFKCSLTKARKASHPQHEKPQVENVFLSEPIVVNSSSDDNRSTSIQCSSIHANTTPLATTWTQTENFFTTELSSYLSFCQTNKTASSLEELHPLDLSLPHRERKLLGSCFMPEVQHQALTQLEENKSASNSWSSDLSHEVEVVKETLGGAETILNTELRFEARCGDTTTSSEESENSNRFYKLDMTQVRAVQMRLNESFFFKTKGEPRSPRPDSPLMKLSQGRKVQGRKKQ